MEDGAATLTEYTVDLLCAYISSQIYTSDLPNKISNKLILTGGGRKNKFLIRRIKEKLGNSYQVLMIDDFGIDGDFVESQAFAFLAIRSLNKLPTSYPFFTGCKKETIGGEIFKN